MSELSPTQAVLAEIEAERRRHIKAGHTADYDNQINPRGQLRERAAAYTEMGTREYLIRAAALIVAEIERLDRKEKQR